MPFSLFRWAHPPIKPGSFLVKVAGASDCLQHAVACTYLGPDSQKRTKRSWTPLEWAKATGTPLMPHPAFSKTRHA